MDDIPNPGDDPDEFINAMRRIYGEDLVNELAVDIRRYAGSRAEEEELPAGPVMAALLVASNALYREVCERS